MRKLMNSVKGDPIRSSTRPDPKGLSHEENMAVARVKNLGQHLLDAIDDAGASREASIAKTNIEQGVMWAVKGITS